ncbi:MAG TPA: radical SAM protein [Thermoanaerobaculia bacterium]
MIYQRETGGRIFYMIDDDTFCLEMCAGEQTITITRALSAGCLLTSKCNRFCPHCYGDDESLPEGHLSASEWGAIFRHLRSLGILRVDLSGGEPTLRNDLADIVAEARYAGLAVVLSTNGTRPPEFLIDVLPRDVRIHVSIDGSTAEIHEGNRLRHDSRPSAGSFAVVCAFIRKMICAGYRVRVLTAIGQHNSGDVLALGELLVLLGVTDWNISMVLRAGRAMSDYDDRWTVDADRVVDQVSQVRAAYPHMRIGFSDRTDQKGYFLLVQNDGTLATQFTDGTDKRVIGSALDVTESDLRDHAEFDLDAHVAKWIGHVIACQRLDCPCHSAAPAQVKRASSAIWIDERTTAIARLDGCLVIAREEDGKADLWQVSRTNGPLEMIVSISSDVLVTSYGDAALAIWWHDAGNYVLDSIVPYASTWGPACSGLYLPDREVLVTGHRTGLVCFWRLRQNSFIPQRSVSMCSPAPVAAESPISDVRAVARWRECSIVTGSEDGDLCLVNIDTGAITHRQRYNEDARCGINSVAVKQDYLLVGNCAVGPDDGNIWLYRIEDDASLTLLDRSHLMASTEKDQVFNFSVQLIEHEGLRFYASTEEGYVWTGLVVDDALVITGSCKLEDEGGLVLAAALDGTRLLAAGKDLHLLNSLEL